MTQPLSADDFRRLALERFPELREEFADFAGLLHVQMGAFARRTQQAKGTADWDTYQQCIALADELWQRPSEELLNALNVSFLENLDFEGPRGPVAWEYLSPGLKLGWRTMQRYLEEVARFADKKRGKRP
jgi:hypothetical protein